MAEWKDICFETETVKQLYIWLDRNWTIEALTNLIKNAVEYSPVGGKVEVEAQENDIYTQITIRDHGTGISKEEREKLFCRFYRGKNAGKDSTGIGLSLSRKIVEAQGGRISGDSGEGRGTTFTLRFMKEA
ncbi:MAG: HAMP domain-containing histidine kinase [Acetatifactor sp.]|nr:HAMP domain-containing histidine kinase [Acetatifactor sp.]